jgi:predicted ATP-dependent serine protease
MLTILGGTSGDGKTYESLHVAICVAAGLPWFGRRVQPARVLLVLLEGAAADRKARILKLARGLGTTLAALQGRLDLYPHDLKADNPRSLAALNDYIARLGYGLVVIDNLSEIRSTGAHGAENDTAIMTAVLKPLADLAHARQAGILLLHHANARGELRGSSAIRQHADAVFEMDRASPANDAPVTLTRTKDRTGETFESLTYRMLDDDSAGRENRRVIPELVTRNRRGAATVETTEPVSVSDLTARQVALRDIVHENPGLGVNAIGRAYTERTGKSPSMRDVTADLAWLVDDGQLRREDAKKYFPVEDW